MIDQVLSRPATQANVATQIDFLELAALIDPSGRVRIDTLIGDRLLQAEEAEDDTGNADRAKDEFIESIENEYNVRAKALGQSYPFRMSDNVEELTLHNHDGDHLAGSYLVCLIASHIGGRSDLQLAIPSEEGLCAEIITRMRKRIFQMIGTIALAGRANGSAASVGSPRVERETISETMNRAFERGFPIPIRAEPNPMASGQAKDHGVDVVAWEKTCPPPSALVWFGQIASGRNWRDKSVIDAARRFASAILEDAPPNKNHATIIPFNFDADTRETKAIWHNHGYILDRKRLATNFKFGLDLSTDGVEMDESENTYIALEWVNEFVQGLRDLFGET